MGGHPYWYVVPYQSNLQAALDELRQREFKAGRYNPVMPWMNFPIGPDAPSPGPKHRTIADALEASDADGTRSILDIERISESADYSTASPLEPALLEQYYGTTRPTRTMVEENMDVLDELERGQAVYIPLYSGNTPTEVMFVGISFD